MQLKQQHMIKLSLISRMSCRVWRIRMSLRLWVILLGSLTAVSSQMKIRICSRMIMISSWSNQATKKNLSCCRCNHQLTTSIHPSRQSMRSSNPLNKSLRTIESIDTQNSHQVTPHAELVMKTQLSSPQWSPSTKHLTNIHSNRIEYIGNFEEEINNYIKFI